MGTYGSSVTDFTYMPVCRDLAVFVASGAFLGCFERKERSLNHNETYIQAENIFT